VIAKPTFSCLIKLCVYQLLILSKVTRLAIATPFNRAWLVLPSKVNNKTNSVKIQIKSKKKKNAKSESDTQAKLCFAFNVFQIAKNTND